jgi:hypothetical protein
MLTAVIYGKDMSTLLQREKYHYAATSIQSVILVLVKVNSSQIFWISTKQTVGCYCYINKSTGKATL